MKSRSEAYMDGIALSSISPDIIVLDIAHATSGVNYSGIEILKRNGKYVTYERQGGSSASVSFEIHTYDIQKRQQILQDVIRWAKGKVLKTNDRKGQRLNVKCTDFPVIESALSWTDPLTVEFTAFEKPFWEEETPSVLELTGDDEEGVFYAPGNAGKALVELIVTPVSTMANFAVSVGNTAMSFTGIDATEESPLVISYDDNQFLSIKVGDTSVMSKRTGSDDLLIECGEQTDVSFTSSVEATVEFRTRGLWM